MNSRASGVIDMAGSTAASASAASQPSVAYVMNGFPRLSETFIAHEIHQLERLGLKLRLYTVKDEREAVVHPVVDAIRAPLVYLPAATSLSGTSLVRWLRDNLVRFWPAHAALLRRRPAAWLTTAASALVLAVRHRPSPLPLRKVFVKEFLQAGWIANAALDEGCVAHLHGHFCHGVATITWFASRLSGLPFSFTAHAKDIYQRELNPGRLLESKLGAARFVATCTCANAHVLRARHPRPEDVHTIYHGLDTDWFAPRWGAARRDVPLLLAVGRLVEKKGFDRLVQACALLRQRGVALRCRIVGEEGSAGPALRAQIAALGLSDCVQLQGAMAQDCLREVYRSAHVFALPCRVMEDGDRDGFPNVLAEAMAMGVPVVSTPISGIPEMIDDGVHGLLVDGSATALADAIERLLADATLHAQLAAAARARICERFDSRRTTVALRDLFTRELARAVPAWRGAAA
jgi:glycosyltransferase involved in cell wall biosynthesis